MTHEPAGQRSARRGRAAIISVAFLVAVMVAAGIVAATRHDGEQRVGMATCPDAGSVPALSAEYEQLLDDAENPACTDEPETTTTSVEPTTTTVDATVDTSPPVSRLTGSKDGLEVTVDVRPPELAAADILTLAITARDVDGGLIAISVTWEPDRGGTVRTHRDCRPGPHPTTPSEETVERKFAFRHAGVAPISVTVSTAYCAGSGTAAKTLKVAGRVVVGPGPLLSNGPLPIDLKARVGDASTDTTTVVAMYAYEVDGFIHRVEVDWGDGSPGEVVTTPLGQCDDPLHTWPGPSRFNRGFAHDYPPGAYTARVTVRSSGCDGRDEQVRTVDVDVT